MKSVTGSLLLELAWAAMVLLGCQAMHAGSADGPADATPTASSASRAMQTVSSAQPNLVPTGSVLRHLEEDLANDGETEQITAFQAGQQVAIAVAAAGGNGDRWVEEFPVGASLVDLSVKDVNNDGRREVLLVTKGGEQPIFDLTVLVWASDQRELLTPKGGPCDGLPSFRSEYYKPVIDSLSGGSGCQIIIWVRSSDPRFLDTVVYDWSGQDYRKTELYLLPPRLAPTPAPS